MPNVLYRDCKGALHSICAVSVHQGEYHGKPALVVVRVNGASPVSEIFAADSCVTNPVEQIEALVEKWYVDKQLDLTHFTCMVAQ